MKRGAPPNRPATTLRETYQAGVQAFARGDFEQARLAFGQVARVARHDPDVYYNLGLATHLCGSAREAVPLYRKAIRFRPAFANAWLNLGNAQQELGDLADAEDSFRRALALEPGNQAALRNLGNLKSATGEFREAAQCYRRSLEEDPENQETRLRYGSSLLLAGDAAQAVAVLQELTRRDTDNAMAFRWLGQALEAAFRVREAERALRRAIERGCEDAVLYNCLGNCLLKQERIPEAEAAYRKALQLDANAPGLVNNLGVVLAAQGRRDEARDTFRHAIALRGNYGDAWRNLAQLTDFRGNDGRDIETMEALLRGGVGTDDEMHLRYALGKAYDELGRYDEAFAHYALANGIRRAIHPPDLDGFASWLERICSVFDHTVASPTGGHDSTVPIFVVGLPRSGTTLVEQILASHPRIAGSGERVIINEILRELEVRQRYPESVADLTADQLCAMGRRYVDELCAGIPMPPIAHVVDKMPYNFLHLGFIRMILPQARVIHCRRDAMDVCLSNFFQYFPPGGIDFSNDLLDLGRFHGLYEKIMAHWRRTIPEWIIDVQYEQIVNDRDRAIRSMLDALGLEWDDRCLDFHRTERAVSTVSVWQVRQPIYSGSMGRWRHYASHLGPLLDALAKESGRDGDIR